MPFSIKTHVKLGFWLTSLLTTKSNCVKGFWLTSLLTTEVAILVVSGPEL